jgi:hypothetical protein
MVVLALLATAVANEFAEAQQGGGQVMVAVRRALGQEWYGKCVLYHLDLVYQNGQPSYVATEIHDDVMWKVFAYPGMNGYMYHENIRSLDSGRLHGCRIYKGVVFAGPWALDTQFEFITP